jgi:ribosome-binding factor A
MRERFVFYMTARTQKIGSVIQRALAPLLIEHEEEHGLITISEVRVMPDLSEARVYVFSPRSVKRLLEDLNARAGYFQKQISHSLTQKRTPRIRFFLDTGVLAAQRIDDLLEQ